MSVQTEIDRLETAKAAIGTAIAGKGVAVPSGTKLDGMAALINGIEQGSDPVLQSKTVTPATSAQTVKPDSGYDGLSQVTVNAMPTATQATPSISVSSAGLITASATQSAGYVAAGTKKATKQLTVQAAQTITPGTTNKTIASGRYLTGTQTIKGDSNLVAGNIKSGVSIFGVAGTFEGSGGGGGGGGSVETCTVRLRTDDIQYRALNVSYMTADVNGNISAHAITNSSSLNLFIENVVCGSIVTVYWNTAGTTEICAKAVKLLSNGRYFNAYKIETTANEEAILENTRFMSGAGGKD